MQMSVRSVPSVTSVLPSIVQVPDDVSTVAKVPVQLAVGQREVENRSVAMRRLGSKQQKVLPLDEALDALEAEVRERR